MGRNLPPMQASRLSLSRCCVKPAAAEMCAVADVVRGAADVFKASVDVLEASVDVVIADVV